MTENSLSLDVFDREIHPGDIALVLNTKCNIEKYDISHVGIASGKNKYFVFDNHERLVEIYSNDAYLLTSYNSVLEEYKNKLIKCYKEYSLKILKENIKNKEFKNSKKKHVIGDLFLDKENHCYIYLGERSFKFEHEIENSCYEYSGKIYLRMIPEKLEMLDKSNITFDDIMNCAYFDAPSNLYDSIFALKRQSTRFIDYYCEEPLHIKDLYDNKSDIYLVRFKHDYFGRITWLLSIS